MIIVLSLAIIAGIFNCFITIRDTRCGSMPAAKPSNSLIDFTFLNR